MRMFSSDASSHTGIAKLGSVDTVVLDEADKLLSVDFVSIVERLLEHVKRDRQILMFRFVQCFPCRVAFLSHSSVQCDLPHHRQRIP